MDNELLVSLMEDVQFTDIMYEDVIEEGFLSEILAGLKNLMVGAQYNGNFEAIHDNLLKLVSKCKNSQDIKRLRNDLHSANKFLDKYAEIVSIVEKDGSETSLPKGINKKEIQKRINKGLSSKKIRDHKKWLQTVYADAINKKAKELREKNK